MIDQKTMPFLPVAAGNHLVLTHSKRGFRNGMGNDDDYYNEVDAQDVVVASYHVWHRLSIYPPQHVNQGWENKDPSGNVVAKVQKQGEPMPNKTLQRQSMPPFHCVSLKQLFPVSLGIGS